MSKKNYGLGFLPSKFKTSIYCKTQLKFFVLSYSFSADPFTHPCYPTTHNLRTMTSEKVHEIVLSQNAVSNLRQFPIPGRGELFSNHCIFPTLFSFWNTNDTKRTAFEVNTNFGLQGFSNTLYLLIVLLYSSRVHKCDIL